MTDMDWRGDISYAAPPLPRHRRRWPWVLLVVVVVLLGLLAVADRIAVSVAQNKIADRLADERPFVGRPSVTIHGFPFATQALQGVYRDIEVKATGEPVGALGPVRIDAHMHNVHLPLSEAADHVDRVPVDRAELAISVSLTALAAASGVEGLTLTADGDKITARAPLNLPLLGEIPVSATGHLSINSSGGISAVLDSFEGVGAVLPSSALEALGIVVAVDDLPFQSVATGVRVRDGDVVLSATARNVILGG